jgi:hypothetical protein
VHAQQRLATRWRARLGGRAPSSPTLAGWQGTSDVCQDGKLVYVHCSHCEGSGVRVPCGRVLSTHLLHRSNSWRFRGSKSTPLRGFRTHFCIFRRFRGYRGVRHEGALRQDRFKQARAGHVNSRLKIAKPNNKNQHHTLPTPPPGAVHVRGSHASIDDWGRMIAMIAMIGLIAMIGNASFRAHQFRNSSETGICFRV